MSVSVKATVMGKKAGADKSTVNPAKNKPAVHSAKQQNFGKPNVSVGKSFKSIVK